MFQMQLRRYLPDGVTPAEVMDTIEIQTTGAESATELISVKVSLSVAEGVKSWIESNPGKAFVVGVEHAVDGGAWFAPRNDRFVLFKGGQDDADPAEIITLSGHDWVTWQLMGTYLHWAPGAKDNARLWTESGHPASAGTIIGGMIWESQKRGWGVIGGAQRFGVDFTWDKDSNGVAWTAAEKVKQPWPLGTPLSKVLGQLVEGGLCEWWTEGTTLRLFRPGVGEDRSDVVLGGAGFSRAPGAWDFSGVGTHFTIIPEKADHWLYETVVGADTSNGRREKILTLSGVSDHATASTLAKPSIDAARSAQREQSYEWTVTGDMPIPGVHFQKGDLVTIQTAFGPRKERVVELIKRMRGDVVTCVAVTGDRMLSAIARKERTVLGGVLGDVVGGSGAALPVGGAPTITAPLAPTGLRVASNVGSWREDGTAQSTVKLEWDAVSQTVDGSAVDIAGYEVAARTLTTDPVIFATVEALAVTASEWEPGKERLVKVRARDHRGQVSAWSGEISVTPDVPLSIIPKAPTGLAVISNTAAFQADNSSVATVTFGWNAVTQSIDNTLVDVVEYEVHHGLSTQRVSGLEASITLPTTKQGTVRVRALTSLGVWGDPSAPITVTGASPAVLAGLPTKPVLTTGQGIVAYAWGGSLTTGAPGAGLNGVVAEFALAAAGPWSPVGALMSAAGGGVIKGLAGQTIWVRYRTKDTLGRTGAPSEAASIVVTAVGAGDIDQAILDAITQAQSDATAAGTAAATAQSAAGSAQTTATAAQGAASTAQSAADQAAADALAAAGIANGKGKVIYQVSAPTGANANANNLWIRTSDNKPHTYNGTTWVAVTDKAATDAAAAAATADGKAVTAKQAADAAQAKADQAFANAAAAATAAGNAQASADGKNRVWYQTAPPAGTGHKVNDIWFDTDNGNAIAYWTGTAWGAAPLGTAAIQDAAITNAKIANLDAAKITTGYLDVANRIRAKAMSVEKLMIGSFDNLIPDPTLAGTVEDYWSAAVGSTSRWSIVNTVGLPGRALTTTADGTQTRLASRNTVAVKPGQKMAIGYSAHRTAWVGTAPFAGLVFRTATGGYVAAVNGPLITEGWADYSIIIEVPNNETITQAQWEINVPVTATAGNVWVGKPVWREAITGTIIDENTVLTRHLKADEIWANTAWVDLATVNVLKAGVVKVDMLEPNIGDSLNLFGNTAINMLVGRTDAADSHLTNLDGQVAGAQNTADTAKDNANAASNAAATVSNRLTEHQLTFGIEPDMVRIGRPSGASEVRLRPDPAVELVVNGVVGASLSESVLTVPEAKLEKAVIAGLRVEGDGNGGTLFMLM